MTFHTISGVVNEPRIRNVYKSKVSSVRPIDVPHHVARIFYSVVWKWCRRIPSSPVLTVFLLEEHGRPTAFQIPVGHDCNAVAEEIRLIHEVGWQDDGPISPLALKNVPRLPARLWVHARSRFVQNYKLQNILNTSYHYSSFRKLNYHCKLLMGKANPAVAGGLTLYLLTYLHNSSIHSVTCLVHLYSAHQEYQLPSLATGDAYIHVARRQFVSIRSNKQPTENARCAR